MFLVKQTQKENNSSTTFDFRGTDCIQNDSEKYDKKSIQYYIFQIRSGF